ncbi:MAG: thiamine phosphate synthase [Clostridia bacterium]|nr:thiamine phosphate synthase [Clostridia bacterium]MDE7328869.1 thiamine phosphate synthase [Clostridia bacterium]
MSDATIEECVEKALKGGVGLVQLREKDCSSKEFYNIALSVKRVTDSYGVPLIINDRVDIALAVGAAGVHVGQSDIPCERVREIVGDDMIIGVSAATVDEAIKAERDGADYIGVGAMYSTSTKSNTRSVSIERLKEIRKAVRIPIVAIGGINKQRVGDFKGTDIDGIAVVSAIVAQDDVESAARELKNAVSEL